MDRDSEQKIRYVIGCLIVVIVLISTFWISNYYKKSICKQQVQELTTIYPEIAIPLQENLSYYQEKLVQVDRITLTVVIGLFFLFSVFFFWSKKWERRKEVEKITLLYDKDSSVYL